MRVAAIGWITFTGALRNKLIVLFFAGFVCLLLLMLTPMLMFKSAATAMSAGQSAGMVLGIVASIMTLVSGFGSLLAAWAAVDAVAGEIKSGTILAVMARPVRRWEFLLGKYLGVQLLMLVYVFFMLGMGYALAWLGGERIQSTPWPLLAYPMVRYAVYSAIAILLVTRLHPVVAFAIVLVIAVAAGIVGPHQHPAYLPAWLKTGLYVALPSTELLSESRFLTITQASLKDAKWTDSVTALVYGLDYALVCFVLAMWSFQRRSLTRE